MTVPLADEMSWRMRAACRGEDLLVFFPERPGVRMGMDVYAEARRICRHCPVARPCFESVIGLPQTVDDSGMFAGLTPKERHQIRKCRAGDCEHPSHRGRP